eukprot:403338199
MAQNFLQQNRASNYSTLNNDVIPDKNFIETVEDYQPKINMELIKKIMNEVGMQSPDERVYKLISVIVEAQLLKIIEEVKQVNIQTQKEPFKTHFSFEDLQKAMEEFGIALRRPPYIEDKMKIKK